MDDVRSGSRALGVRPAVDGRTHKVMILVDVDEQYRSARGDFLEDVWKQFKGSERGAQGT